MKKEFQVLKDRPKISIRLTRDSVAAGDDFNAPHEKTVYVYSFIDPIALISHLASGYLPSVNGVGHSWDCELNRSIIGTISSNGIDSKVSEIQYDKTNEVHFVYHSATY